MNWLIDLLFSACYCTALDPRIAKLQKKSIYYLSDVTVLSKYPNTLQKLTELLVHGIVPVLGIGLHITNPHLVTYAQKLAPVFSRAESM